MNVNTLDYADPFDVDKITRLIHLYKSNELSPADRGALLSRYSRSNKSMLELIDTEFKDKNRGAEFYKKVLGEYGDDSIAELDSEGIGIEGISIIAASKLTDKRIGVSFLEKSTRYLPFSEDAFYIPAEIYEMGLVDDFKDLCAASYHSFQYMDKELRSIITERYPITNCTFFDSKAGRDVAFENLSLEEDSRAAERAYARAVRDRAYDNASYCWLGALKTNIGLNANCRAIESMLHKMYGSPLSELNALGNNIYHLMEPAIGPFITRARPPVITTVITKGGPLGAYGAGVSEVALYKHNITNLLQTYDNFTDDLNAEFTDSEKQKHSNHVRHNVNLIKSLISEMGIVTNEGNKIGLKETKMSKVLINAESFKPSVNIVAFMNEKYCIDMLTSAILYEHNENLLDYDEQNINNIDQNLRILDVDPKSIKQGILYEMINGQKSIEDFNNLDVELNRTTENTLSFNDIMAYQEEAASVKDTPIYQNYNDTSKLTINKEQEYLIKKYLGDRRSRRDKLGRAFEFIDYTIELSTSFRVMRDLKRHRIGSFLYPQVITARNSYDSYIFPDLIITNEDLFNEYRELIEKSFEMYNKIIKKSNNYHVAQYANILGVRANYVMKMNFRQLDYMLSLRTMAAGHEEYRSVCHGVYNLLKVLHPNLSKFIRFIDLNTYPLGRLKYEFSRERKLQNNTT